MVCVIEKCVIEGPELGHDRGMIIVSKHEFSKPLC